MCRKLQSVKVSSILLLPMWSGNCVLNEFENLLNKLGTVHEYISATNRVFKAVLNLYSRKYTHVCCHLIHTTRLGI